jgi:hypothetical protein
MITLEEFCRHLQVAQDKEEILLRRPWTDEEQGITYFRLKDFENFLKKNKFFEYKSHRIAQRLRDINGSSVVLKIKGRAVRVWQIPAFDTSDIDITHPNLVNHREHLFNGRVDVGGYPTPYAEIVHMIDNELMTMTAVAKWFGISKQRVQQIYSKGKGKGCLEYSGHREQAKLPRC